MAQAVDAGIRGKAFRHGHDELWVNDGHIRGQRIVGEGHFAPALFVGQNRKRSDFAPGSAGRGYGDQSCPVDLLGRVLGYAFAEIQERRGQFCQVGFWRFVLEFHDLGRVDHRPTSQRDDLVRFVEIERLHPLHDYLELGLGIRNNRDVNVSFRWNVAPDDIHVAELLQSRVGNNDGAARREITQILHRIQVEVDLIGNPEPHMGLCSPSHALDVEVVIDICVVSGAVATAGPAPEGEGGHQIVVNGAQRSDGAWRVHNDPPRVHDLTELTDDLVVARENNRRMPKAAGMVHVHADLERLIYGFRSVDGEQREQLLDGQGMFTAYAFNRRDQEFGIRLNRKTDTPGNVGGLLPDGHGLHETSRRIDNRARQQLRLFLVANVRTQLRKFVQHRGINLIIDHHRLLGGANSSIVESLGDDDVHHRSVQVCRPFKVNRRVTRPYTQRWFT